MRIFSWASGFLVACMEVVNAAASRLPGIVRADWLSRETRLLLITKEFAQDVNLVAATRGTNCTEFTGVTTSVKNSLPVSAVIDGWGSKTVKHIFLHYLPRVHVHYVLVPLVRCQPEVKNKSAA
ncbi:hypothetical protein P153DRAFT_386368 [Dothidotthia symphoricarpi CBS 119687]|uniref:Uncharacterized protein n=1 Tax=Dothidotthia symphoricarpi CBS 119687 TaxID=1392245 RepID=A0A6A6AC71_9PLEO|nr:uncharacterized protein P153DRAFT_386368 [Dothidotthia symphoricarpi CBS 119687]KAF2129186.1 hypothetical protein P153DRAFT_386368 [Dothidotthia symphoricarpi CBS 119687]